MNVQRKKRVIRAKSCELSDATVPESKLTFFSLSCLKLIYKEEKEKEKTCTFFFLSFVITFQCQRENVMKMPKKRTVESIAFIVFIEIMLLVVNRLQKVSKYWIYAFKIEESGHSSHFF